MLRKFASVSSFFSFCASSFPGVVSSKYTDPSFGVRNEPFELAFAGPSLVLSLKLLQAQDAGTGIAFPIQRIFSIS
jgi:hypothetical protein